MDPKAIIADLSSKLPTLIFIGIRVVFIAIIFEFLAWLAGNRIEKLASPFIGVDAGRDPKWRAQRRATLRQTPKLITRTLLYTVALILVFDVFGVPVLPLSSRWSRRRAFWHRLTTDFSGLRGGLHVAFGRHFSARRRG